MKKRRFFYGICGGVLSATLAYAVPVEPTCINYWVVGDSGCTPEAVTKTVAANPVLPPPVVERNSAEEETAAPQTQAQEKTLDERIDDFMENHGKPPREFVAFHLEPTLENALKWVYKYKDMLRRNIELTRAWMQAEAIYDQANPDEQKLVAGAVETNPVVPDFGINLPGMPSTEGIPGLGAPSENAAQAKQPAQKNPLLQRASLQNNRPSNPFSSTNTLEDGRIGGGNVMKIDYYFSADCPYCKKFEPEFNQVLSQIDQKIEVTCVDLTPSNREPSNIFGKVDCAWRSAGAAEMQRMGIRTTPSLIIDRGHGQPLERISGYVEADKLKEHLLKNNTIE